MATTNVPIEIVLQDPNNPIVPTPDSDGGSDNANTNSNIAVPNTAVGEGHTTMDGSGNNTSNIFTGPTATVSIVSVVILALALSGIITLLIHKYYKNKKTNTKTKATKKEHFATATASTVAVLAATVLVGQLLMTTTNAAASEGTVLSTPDKIQIIANRHDDVTIVASTKAVSYATTDTSFGYKIFVSMAGEDANLYLNGDTDNEYYFAPTTRVGLSNNSWGYSLDDGAEQAMPLPDNAIMAQQNTSAASDDEFDVYYSMKADKDMPFGVYSGEIAYDIEGYNGFPSTLTTMQGMTSEICESTYTPNAFKADGVTIEDNVPTATLADIRDNKTYTIAKLADGKCWMTQNLDLQKEDLLQGVTLDNTNTDNPASGFELPDSQVERSSEQWSSNAAHVYDLAGDGRDYHYCIEYGNGPCNVYDEANIPSKDLGNYYNWYAATAGANMDGSSDKASGSICPAGWRLPSGSNNSGATDYSYLMYDYGVIANFSGQLVEYKEKIPSTYGAPLLLSRVGEFGGYMEYGPTNVGMRGYYFTSEQTPWPGGNYSFIIGGTQSNPWGSIETSEGASVRCVAK